MNLQRYAYGLLIFIATVFILYIGKSILLPLTLAVIGWYLINELLSYLDRIIIKQRKIPRFIQQFLTFVIVLASFMLFSGILLNSANSIEAKIPEYQDNLKLFIENLHLPINLDYKDWLSTFTEQFDISALLGYAVSSVSSIFSNIVLILLYFLFVLFEAGSFRTKLNKIYSNDSSSLNINSMIDSINTSMSNYITLKTITSLATGVFSYLVLELVGVDFAIFWAYLIFLLNYVPTIGSLIATLFPVLLALLQFGTWVQPTIILVAVGSIQVLVGNVIEPKLMGNSLNVSPLVVLISLAFWGWLWGVVGMIISVPITIMMIIVCAQFEDLRWIAILLSSDGDLPKINQKEE